MPFLYLCLRYYTSTLVNREERVKELESKLLERLYETFGAMRLVKSFAREPHELQRYAAAGDDDDERAHRDHLAAVAVLGRRQHDHDSRHRARRHRRRHARDARAADRRRADVVINYLGAVYGPLSAIAHTTGQLQGALAGAKRVRAMFALMPETVDAPDAIDATAVKGDIRFEDVGFTYPDGTQRAARHHLRGQAGRDGRARRPDRRRQDDARQPDSALLRRRPTGRVLIDGVDVRQYRVRSLREKIAIVLQDPVLFSGTIADNLRYGRLDATDEEIEAGGARGARARVHLAPAEGLRHRDRRSRRRPVGRRAPAAQRRARDPEERADPDPRRADLVARRDLRGDRLRRAAPPARRPHDDRHRAPPVDRPRRRPHSGARRRHASPRRAGTTSC